MQITNKAISSVERLKAWMNVGHSRGEILKGIAAWQTGQAGIAHHHWLKAIDEAVNRDGELAYDVAVARFLIGKQDEAPLKMIMRSIFLQNSKNLPNNITQQIKQLNKLVLDYAIPQVMGEAIGYVKYKNDSSMMYTPMQRPTSTYYNNTLELKPWF